MAQITPQAIDHYRIAITNNGIETLAIFADESLDGHQFVSDKQFDTYEDAEGFRARIVLAVLIQYVTPKQHIQMSVPANSYDAFWLRPLIG